MATTKLSGRGSRRRVLPARLRARRAERVIAKWVFPDHIWKTVARRYPQALDPGVQAEIDHALRDWFMPSSTRSGHGTGPMPDGTMSLSSGTSTSSMASRTHGESRNTDSRRSGPSATQMGARAGPLASAQTVLRTAPPEAVEQEAVSTGAAEAAEAAAVEVEASGRPSAVAPISLLCTGTIAERPREYTGGLPTDVGRGLSPVLTGSWRILPA